MASQSHFMVCRDVNCEDDQARWKIAFEKQPRNSNGPPPCWATRTARSRVRSSHTRQRPASMGARVRRCRCCTHGIRSSLPRQQRPAAANCSSTTDDTAARTLMKAVAIVDVAGLSTLMSIDAARAKHEVCPSRLCNHSMPSLV